MILVDVNLLLYAYDSSSDFHTKAKHWWEKKLSEPQQLVGISWTTLLAFIRITTNHRIFKQPLNIKEAINHVNNWLERPMVKLLNPTERHWTILSELILETHSIANHIPDAHLAALAIEHGATLCSADHDFARFKKIKWINPLA